MVQEVGAAVICTDTVDMVVMEVVVVSTCSIWVVAKMVVEVPR